MRVFFRPAINNIWLQRRVPIITSTIGGGVRKQQHIAAGTLSMGVLLFVIVIVIVRKQRHGRGFVSKQQHGCGVV